ncbi:glycosyltransferase family 2 protein [Candidatus Bathyarchaeota archaeon]|nr:glycosyltransferase family 2 protein [Candidatus Bathyarchaeota archaeon]
MIRKDPVVSIVIPTLKEGKTIRKVIQDLKNFSSYETEIIVVDGHSNDGTEEIVKEENAEFVSEQRIGYGRAIKTGIDHSKGNIVVIIDADDTYEANAINQLVQPLLDNEADVCLASRLGGTLLPGSMPSMNLFGNRMFTTIYNMLYREKVTDTQTGFRALTKKTIACLDLYSDGMGLSTVFLTEASKQGFRIAEIPTRYRARPDDSRSKLNRIKAGWEIIRILLLGQS